MRRAPPPLDVEVLFGPVAAEKALGLAVSGGVDSLALMVLASEWAPRHGVRLRVFTVDHGLRPQARDECQFVVETAHKLGLEAELLQWQGDKPAANIQAAARAARYRLLGEAMKANEIKVLASAHQCEDQAETVLMRLGHGSGLEGLQGMQPLTHQHGMQLFRPLLGVGRAELAALVAKQGLVPVDDPSNRQTSFERVRWRHELTRLDALGLDARRICDFAGRAGRADAALDYYADEALAKIARLSAMGMVRLDRAGLFALPEEIGLRIFRRSLAWCGGQRKPFALSAVEALLEQLRADAKAPARTLCGAVVRARPDWIELVRETRHLPQDPMVVDEGATAVWDERFRVENRNRDWPIRVGPGKGVTRRMAEAVLQMQLPDPAIALNGAPLVWRGDGEILAIGGCVLSEDVRVGPSGWGANLKQIGS